MITKAVRGLRRKTAWPMAHLVARVLRAGIGSQEQRLRLWQFADRYISFWNVTDRVTVCNGCAMQVGTDSRVENELFYFGEWEPLFSRYLLDKGRQTGVFLDIGANIGYFSILASRLYTQVHAVEASPRVARRLKDNLQANDSVNVQIHNLAIGAEPGYIDFFRDQSQSGGSSVFAGEGRTFEARVPVAGFDEIFSEIDLSQVRFIKIDIEGSEPPVLRDILQRLDAFSPDLEIFLEYDPASETASGGREPLWPILTALLEKGCGLFEMQGPYDRRDYVDPRRRSMLTPVKVRPDCFCDLLIRRQARAADR